MLQVVGLAVTLTALVLTIQNTPHVALPIVIGIVVAMQVLGLIHSVQSHVDALEDFFAAVNYEDFTRRFIEDDVDSELKDAFNRILERFQDARAQRDLKAGYLDTVIRHVPVPFMAARSDGALSLVNNPARRLMGLSTMNNISDLAAVDPALPAELERIDAGQQRLLQTKLRGIPAELRVSVSEIRMEGETERLYSIENLSGELTARESSAWRNLIRVLTHEVMNTLTPVTSLAQTTVSMLDDPNATEDIREAVTTIGRRSDGMIRFVSKYRELLQIPQPNMETLSVTMVFDSVITLLGDSLKSIDVGVSVTPDSLEVYADSALLDQTLLNLVKNSVQALADTDAPRIKLSGKLDRGRVILGVFDNGPGIPENLLDQVFIPFFTTKRDGSGIGLSLTRQVMTAHGGDVVLETDTSGTTIKLVFS